MTNELHYSPVPKHIAANGRVVGDKVEISAVVYDGKSDVENVRVVHNGSAVNMTRVNGFTWRAELPYSEGKYKIGALFTDSEVRVEEVKFQKGMVWERQLNGFGGLGTPIVSSDLIYVPLVDDQMSEHCGVWL